MKADFTINFLEFPKEIVIGGTLRQPDWGAARRHIMDLPTNELINKIAKGSGFSNDITKVNKNPSKEEVTKALSDFVENVNSVVEDWNGNVRYWSDLESAQEFFILTALSAVNTCKDMWSGNSEGTHIVLSNALLLVTGSSADGFIESIESIMGMNMFKETGAAKAAGFII